MAAVPYNDKLCADINKWYRINVSIHLGMKTVIIKGIEQEIDRYGTTKITSAAQLSKHIDEKLKIKLFNKVLDSGKDEPSR